MGDGGSSWEQDASLAGSMDMTIDSYPIYPWPSGKIGRLRRYSPLYTLQSTFADRENHWTPIISRLFPVEKHVFLSPYLWHSKSQSGERIPFWVCLAVSSSGALGGIPQQARKNDDHTSFFHYTMFGKFWMKPSHFVDGVALCNHDRPMWIRTLTNTLHFGVPRCWLARSTDTVGIGFPAPFPKANISAWKNEAHTKIAVASKTNQLSIIKHLLWRRTSIWECGMGMYGVQYSHPQMAFWGITSQQDISWFLYIPIIGLDIPIFWMV